MRSVDSTYDRGGFTNEDFQIACHAVTAAVLTLPMAVLAQESHEDAKAQVERHDAHHHNKAKIVGGLAVGGALIGAKVGGPGGALVGAPAWAQAAVWWLINKARKHHAIKQREKYAHPAPLIEQKIQNFSHFEIIGSRGSLAGRRALKTRIYFPISHIHLLCAFALWYEASNERRIHEEDRCHPNAHNRFSCRGPTLLIL